MENNGEIDLMRHRRRWRRLCRTMNALDTESDISCLTDDEGVPAPHRHPGSA
jgi:hypothetical protein